MRKVLLILVLVATPVLADESKTGREMAAAAAEAFERGSSEEAVTLLRRALKLEPANAVYKAALGQIYLFTGRAADAVPLLNQSVRAAPGDIEIRIALVQAYQNLEKDLEALRTLGSRAPAEPHRPVWLFLQGFSLFRTGQTNQAKKAFFDLMAYPDMRAPAHFFLANCHYVENDLDAALLEYEVAISAGDVPTNKALNAYYYNYGMTLYRLRRFEESAAAFRKSIQRFSRDPLPRFFLARSLTERGSFREAGELLDALVAEFPDFSPAFYQLARLQAANGDKSRAQELFRKYNVLKEKQRDDESTLQRQIKLGR